MILKHEFVEYIPEHVVDGAIYVSIRFATALHKCCCGCGNEVVTPLSPTDWKVTFDGETISLHPSIGNWNFPCQSHYWIKRNVITWAPQWSRDQIAAGRADDQRAKKRYERENNTESTTDELVPRHRRFRRSIKRWF